MNTINQEPLGVTNNVFPEKNKGVACKTAAVVRLPGRDGGDATYKIVPVQDESSNLSQATHMLVPIDVKSTNCKMVPWKCDRFFSDGGNVLVR